jgi:hypothetical protein
MTQFLHTFRQQPHLVNGLWYHYEYEGLPVNLKHGPLIFDYLDSIYRTIGAALAISPRTFAVRFDLHLPANFDERDTAVISRFFASLKAQLDAADARNYREGKRVHPHNLRYIWVCEIGAFGKPHYHVLVLLNEDRFRTLGSFSAEEGNLSARIKKAWASALRLPVEQATRLVHFPDNPQYHLDVNEPGFRDVLKKLFFRVSYFAKTPTKVFDRERRSFGASWS